MAEVLASVINTVHGWLSLPPGYSTSSKTADEVMHALVTPASTWSDDVKDEQQLRRSVARCCRSVARLGLAGVNCFPLAMAVLALSPSPKRLRRS